MIYNTTPLPGPPALLPLPLALLPAIHLYQEGWVYITPGTKNVFMNIALQGSISGKYLLKFF